MTTAHHDATVCPETRSIESSIQFATAGVRLAGGTVTEEDEAAARRVLCGETTVEEELAALRTELGC
ncbi:MULTISPECIES: antitoxin VbhA family protein [Rhodococcus]|uniref:antitoxin VbhA family protein n=1 Tax=Rhodococcus TaxID=1827 RepID=UPI0029532D95|nr:MULTISPECIES: antitoxin VbhA family protein [Rhodococcus]MDV7246213.1 antitoxin VbhA family protein [Rhodococcus oxybenzonivorans]MDV7337315.1 antitoxin VbhA family protein [Rhodococcus oxybenzonivorans]MDV8031741.1 antitoxin VbhA family protein [Rhodococcus sp. IEGM 27]